MMETFYEPRHIALCACARARVCVCVCLSLCVCVCVHYQKDCFGGAFTLVLVLSIYDIRKRLQGLFIESFWNATRSVSDIDWNMLRLTKLEHQRLRNRADACRNWDLHRWESRALKTSQPYAWGTSEYSSACFTQCWDFFRGNVCFPGSLNVFFFPSWSSSNIKWQVAWALNEACLLTSCRWPCRVVVTFVFVSDWVPSQLTNLN